MVAVGILVVAPQVEVLTLLIEGGRGGDGGWRENENGEITEGGGGSNNTGRKYGRDRTPKEEDGPGAT